MNTHHITIGGTPRCRRMLDQSTESSLMDESASARALLFGCGFNDKVSAELAAEIMKEHGYKAEVVERPCPVDPE